MTKYTAKNILLELNDGTKVIPYTDKLDRDLGNTNSAGDNKLITSKIYDPGMTILTDKKGYEELYKERHSTFDRSKLTKEVYTAVGMTKGYYINASGVVTQNSPAMYTALIPVSGYTSVILSGVSNTVDLWNRRVHAYTADGTWISNIAVATASGVGTSYTCSGDIPSNAAYVRLSLLQSDSSLSLKATNVKGSPTITDDGIASGFSTSKYVNTNYNWSQLYNKNIVFTTRVIVTEQFFTDESYVFGTASSGLTFSFYGKDNRAAVFTHDGNAWSSISVDYTKPNIGDVIDITITKTNNSVKLDYVSKYDNLTKTRDGLTFASVDTPVVIGFSQQAKPFLGQIDLKYFSITVNNTEVLGYNRQGVDLIKRYDCTIIPETGSTVSINSEGIASGFSLDDYIKTVLPPYTNELIIEGHAKCNDYSGHNRVNGNTIASNTPIISFNTDGQISFGLLSRDSVNTGFYAYNNDFYYRMVQDISAETFKVYLKSNYDDAWVLYNTQTSATTNVGGQPYYFGRGYSEYFDGVQNLNYIKIYADGRLVYHPVLQIPYTLSKTGKKIVDSVYRDRVKRMYNEFGYTHYYTIGNALGLGTGYITGDSCTIDGSVVSGFSANSTFMTGLEFTGDISNYDWAIELSMEPRTSIRSNGEIVLTVPSSAQYSLLITPDHFVFYAGKVGDGAGARWHPTTMLNTKFYIRLEYTADGTYGIYYKYNKADEWELGNKIEGATTHWGTGTLQLSWLNSASYYLGSIDMSDFKVFSKGEEIYNFEYATSPYAHTMQTTKNQKFVTSEVVSGNVPEKYNTTSVGTPTLSGGIASGFTTSKYLKTPELNLDTDNYSIELSFTTPSTIPTGTDYAPIFVGSTTGQCIISAGISGGNLVYGLSSNGTSWDIVNDASLEQVAASTTYKVKLVFNGTQYTPYVNGVQKTPVSSTSKIYNASSTTLNLGVHRNLTSAFTGTIDLSQFIIVVDGVEVYRAYTPAIQSTITGSYKQRADLLVTQRGTCVKDSPVTLTKPYKDSNYALTIPYSAKTATGFTPSRSGDYITRGTSTLD